jgi:hypothetical protein
MPRFTQHKYALDEEPTNALHNSSINNSAGDLPSLPALPERRRALIARLTHGADKADAAREFEISIVTVTQVLRSEVGLRCQWERARFQNDQSTHRESWLNNIVEHGNLGVKFIRNLNPGTYAWLYRNDRAWLTEHSPTRKQNGAALSQRVQWDKRDLKLSAAVEQAVLTLHSKCANQKLRLWHIYQEIPELKAKLDVLDRLPLTLRAIEIALDRRSAQKIQSDLLDSK